MQSDRLVFFFVCLALIAHFITLRRLTALDAGSGAFFGLAAYSYLSGHSQLERQRAQILQSKSMFGMRSRQLGITSISLGLAWLGLWRLVK